MTRKFIRHSLHPSLDATLRAAIAVQIGRPADLSRAGGNPVYTSTPYKEFCCLLDSRLRGNDERGWDDERGGNDERGWDDERVSFCLVLTWPG